MNYRPDRAIQISTLFTNPNFYKEPSLKADGTPMWKAYAPSHPLSGIHFVCTMKYADSVKGHIAFELPKMTNILGVWLADNGYTQLRIAETEKYAHVTFFFDATMNFDGVERPELKNCHRVLINSPKVATYDLQPEMSAPQVLDALMVELNKDYLDVVILNFANCDMVGHTAVNDAVVKAVETVDTCVGAIIDWCAQNDATLLVTADHGNAEEILTDDDKPMTAHTTNLVPFCINRKDIQLKQSEGKLADIAPTIIELLGKEKPVEMTGESLIIK
jgi:2,3-bisphosphoglycerate-independent phosphoglycerate mutase